MLDKTTIADAYLAFMRGGHSRLLALVGDDFFDNAPRAPEPAATSRSSTRPIIEGRT